MDTTLLTTAEVAELFRVTAETVGSWVRTGVIPVLSLPSGGGYRFRREDVERLMESEAREPESAA